MSVEEFRAKRRVLDKAWKEKNRQKMADMESARYHRDIEESRRRVNERNAADPSRNRANSHKQRAKRLAAEGSHGPHDIRDLFAKQKALCAANHCRVRIGSKHAKWHIDHIVPLSRGGSNWPGNLQLLCAPCNQSKADSTMDEWALRICRKNQ